MQTGGVMADETLRSIYSAADETIAQLDQLHRLSSERSLTWRQSLDAATARLGDSSAPFVEQVAPGPSAQPGVEGASAPPPAAEPYYALPRRTTHGGPFGPAVRAKLLAAALAKDTRW
jgi:hypothetical protein